MHWRYFTTFAIVLLAEIVGGCSRDGEKASHPATPRSSGSPQPANATAAGQGAAPAVASVEHRHPLRDGRTVVVDSDDHVVILAVDGVATAESSCGVNGISYPRAVAFLTEVIRLVDASDKESLAQLVRFPLRASVPVNTRAEFLHRYDQILAPSEVAAISRADPAAVFCRNGAFMLGDGEIWAEPDETGAYRVTTINPAVPRRRH